MPRIRKWSAAGVGAAAVLLLAGPTVAQNPQWVTIKGKVVWPEKEELPKPGKIDVKADPAHCQMNGDLYYEDVLINPKTRGVKNVWVYLKPATGDTFAPNDINPALAKAAPKNHVIDQPCCQFVPRILAARDGDTVLVKNSAPVAHNIKVDADAPALQINPIMAPKTELKLPAPLQAQKTPISFSCSIHPWMSGRIMVFDHPYFAITDENGNWEIKDAPAGKFRVFYRHENGYHKARDGAKGFPIEIAAAAGGSTMEMKPVDLELPKPAK